MNHDVGGNRKLFRKEMNKVDGGKAKSCSRIKHENGKLAVGVDEVRRI